MSILSRTRWRSLSRLDAVALVVLLVYMVVFLARLVGVFIPRTGFLGFLALVAGVYLLVRLLAWFRRHGLWSLRNRLLVAYLFIAVVPVMLLVGMAWLSAYIIYAQLGAHLLQTDLQERVDKVAAIADAAASGLVADVARVPRGRVSGTTAVPGLRALLESARQELPGLEIDIGGGEEILERQTGTAKDRFAGLTQLDDQIWVQAVVPVPTARSRDEGARRPGAGRVLVSAAVPVSEGFLSSLAPELGAVQMTVWRPAGDEPNAAGQGLVFESGDQRFVPIRQIVARNRSLPPRINWLDFEVTGTCKLEAVSLRVGQAASALRPVFAPFSARASQLNRRLFSSLGELGGRPIQLLFLVGIVFLFLEIAALRTGIRLTRSITRAVDDLSSATQQVQAGDLTHTVHVHERDQLGALGESFNEMIASIASLIEEQRQRQKLENELTIAREVQAQLFPQVVPALPGIELAAVCHAARVVSGDYYDFIKLGPNHLAIAIADISGKGISAALLMASLQAALRSQVLLGEEAWRNTAELVSRLNLHLYLNTSPDRYATFFYAVYDATTRTLTYTNAGHLPPYYLVGDKVAKLEEGGMVVGLFKDVPYDQGTVQIEPGSVLVAYSDGLIESENVYGEQFSQTGLLEEVLRRRNRPARELADALVQAAEVWAGSPEQGDDMTVIVARMD